MTVNNNIRKMNRSKSMLFSLLRRILCWGFSFALWKVTLRIISSWWVLRFALMILLPFCFILLSLTFGRMIVFYLRSRLPGMRYEGWFSLFALGFFFSVFLYTLWFLSHWTFSFACGSRRPPSFPLVRLWSGVPALTGASFVRFRGTSFLNAHSFRVRLSDVFLSFLNRSSHCACSFEFIINFFRLGFAFGFISEIVMTFFEGLSHCFSSFYRHLLFFWLPFCLLFVWFFLQSFSLIAHTAWVFLFWGRLLSLGSIGAAVFTFGGRCSFSGWFAGWPLLFWSLVEAFRVAIFEIFI